MSFLEQADKAAQHAEEDSSIVFSNFGRLEMELHSYKVWKELPDGKWTAEEVEENEYNVTKERNRFMEIDFKVIISEMNPKLEFDYKRKVSIISKGKGDWNQIVRPSIDEVFGKDATLASIQGKYVEVQDVPQTRDPEYSTIKFVRVFDSREACKAAYDHYQSQFKKDVADSQPTQSAGLNTHPFDMKQWMEYIVPSVKSELEKGSSATSIANSYAITEEQVKRIQENGL